MHFPSHHIRRRTVVGTWLWAMLVLLPAFAPLASAAPAEQTSRSSSMQAADRSLQLNLFECPPGMDGSTPRALYDACHQNGLVDIPVTMTAADGTVVLKKNTAITEAGPGVVRVNGIPAGDYTVTAALPADGSSYVVECEEADTPATVPFSPANAASFTTTVPTGTDVICDLIVVPAGSTATPTLKVDVTTCTRADLPGAGRTRDDLKGNCVTPSTVPVTFALTGPGGTAQSSSLAAGTTTLSYDSIPQGDLTLASDVSTQENGQYAFCTVDGSTWYPKDLATGSAAFTDVEDEQIHCEWYIVSAGTAQAAVVSTTATGAARIVVHPLMCPGGTSTDAAALQANCTQPLTDSATFSLAKDATPLVQRIDTNGTVTFANVQPGTWRLSTSIPADTASFAVVCSADGGAPYAKPMSDTGTVTFTDVATEQIDCAWYVIPDNARGTVNRATVAATPTATTAPTVAPSPTAVPRASMLVTMFACDPTLATEGASFADLTASCTQTLDAVPVTVGADGGEPITANTGESGAGAIRFYDLLPATYIMTPALPGDYESTAVFCQVGSGDVYQKPVMDGSTTFSDVENEQIACSWFVQRPAPVPTAVPQKTQIAAPAPTSTPHVEGSITVREFLCKGDKSTIRNWEKECQPGATGSSYTLSTTSGTRIGSEHPNASGVLTFHNLAAGKYALDQDTGVWCKAAAERVDSESHLIVEDGTNTDVFLYQCNRVAKLPSTGNGVAMGKISVGPLLASIVVSVAAAAGLTARRFPGRAVSVRHDMNRRSGRR